MPCHLWTLLQNGTWQYLGSSSSSETFLRMQDARGRGLSQFFIMRI